MSRKREIILSFVVVLMLVLGVTVGTTLAHEEDVEGSEDHPLISRI